MDALQRRLRRLPQYEALAHYWDLGDHVGWWDSRHWRVPEFLRCADGCRHIAPELHGSPLFQAERLGDLHYASLMKLFDADRHCTRMAEALDRIRPELDAEPDAAIWRTLDDAIGAFFWCLMGSLDALAGEAALTMGCEHSVFDAHFSSLVNWMQEQLPANRAHLKGHWIDMRTVLCTAFAGQPSGWSRDLRDYRNLLTHRPFLVKSLICRVEDRKIAPRLPCDPAQCSSDAKRFGAFRSDDVLTYLPELWQRVAATMNDAHRVLLETLQARTAAPGEVNNCEMHWRPSRKKTRAKAP